MWRAAILTGSFLMLAACSGGGDQPRPAPPGPPPPPPPVAGCNDAVEFCNPIPTSADPCEDDQFWPLSVSSMIRPLTVHFPRQDDEAKASEMITLLEESWTVQVDMVGFSAPLSDNGACGPDDSFDVFIWRSIDGAFVSSVATNPGTPYQDHSTYMAFDPSGINGGEFLNSFMAHEFNHALQASDDWTEDPQHYEAGATFAEALVDPDDDDWFFEMEDFQGNPQWSLFYDDVGATWYTYAAAMYLHYLYERHFVGDPGFYARIWRGTRSDVGDDRPDYIDALRTVLMTERGVTLDDSIVEFSQWRWFVDQFDDGAHYARGAEWPYPVAFSEIDVTSLPSTQLLDAMMYGANYFRITNNSAATVDINATISSTDNDVTWRLLDVGGGDVVAPLRLLPGEEIVLVAVLLPMEEVWSGNLDFNQRIADLDITSTP